MDNKNIFEFQIGSFYEGFDRVFLKNQTLYHETPSHPDEETNPVLIVEEVKLTDEQFNLFWDNLDKLKVWDWKKDYTNPGIMDGTEWQLKINQPGKKHLKTEGQNAYPKNFNTFLKLINAHIKEELYK